MADPSRQTILSVLATVFALALSATGADAAGASFWECQDGQWVARGDPDYPMPLRSCGETLGIPKTEAECTARGGTWTKVGIYPAKVCRLPTSDAGRTCGDMAECEGGCIARLDDGERKRVTGGRCVVRPGQCAPAVPVVGCHGFVRHGRVCEIICRD